MSISETLLPEFDQEMANTRKVLERVPEGKPAWKPHEKSMSLGRLAGHVAELPSWAVNAIRLSVLNLTPPFQATIMGSQKELLELFDKNVVEARQAIARSEEHTSELQS